MQSQYRYSQPGTPTSGPAWFYGYCHDSRKMRMMNYPDYVRNMQTGYSNLYQDPASVMQQWAGRKKTAAARVAFAAPTPSSMLAAAKHEEFRLLSKMTLVVIGK